MTSNGLHRFQFVQYVNTLYSGTALVAADALVVCADCGATKIVPVETTGGAQ